MIPAKAIKTLSKDQVMRDVILKVGECKLKHVKNRYESLVRAIISQQLAGAAAQAIFKRFSKLGDGRFPKPDETLGFSHKKLRKVGLSERKIEYIRDLSAKIESRELKLRSISRLSDEKVVEQLVMIKGIGRWTAEMFLMFTLGRLDILPLGDLGVRNGFRKMYSNQSMSEKEMFIIAEKWRPFRSIATWYIWQSLTLNID